MNDPIQDPQNSRPPWLRWLLGAGVTYVLVFALVLFFLFRLLNSGLIPGTGQLKVGPGDTLPAISLQTLDGRGVQMVDLRGGYILLDFWASW